MKRQILNEPRKMGRHIFGGVIAGFFSTAMFLLITKFLNIFKSILDVSPDSLISSSIDVLAPIVLIILGVILFWRYEKRFGNGKIPITLTIVNDVLKFVKVAGFVIFTALIIILIFLGFLIKTVLPLLY